jgi:TolB-like protein/Tfp pilus assembly protein PilF
MEVLLCLARHAGEVVRKEEIIREVWEQTFVSDDSLTRCIGELRRAFRDLAREPTVIETISKRGYLLLSPVVWNESNAILPPPPGFETSAEKCPEYQDGRSPVPSGEEIAIQAVHRGGVARRRWLLVGSAACLAAVACMAVAWRNYPRATAAPHIRTIAVLPLVNLSADPQQEYFADGMTEELITEMAQLRACKVISRTSVMRYKGSHRPLREIASELSAEAMIEGTVLRSGARVRITAQLIDAASDKHIWSGSFEREMTDVISLQANIARTIAGELNLALDSRNQARWQGNAKVIPEAYDAYLRGWYSFDRAQYSKAASYFEQSAQLDPTFALAQALLFEADAMTSYIQDQPLSDRAVKALDRARQLDANLAEIHDGNGDLLSVGDWNWEAGLKEYRRAIELNPSSVDASLHYVYSLHTLCRWRAVAQELQRALRIDPVSPAVNLEMLRLLVDIHQHEAALEQFRKVIELDPNSAGAYFEIFPVYAALGREDGAIAAFLKLETLVGTNPQAIEALEDAARKSGLRGCLKKRIEQLQKEPSSVSPYVIANLFAQLGDRERAFRYLEQAYREHRPRMMWVQARATWDSLRPDPRFHSLLQRMRFPQ